MKNCPEKQYLNPTRRSCDKMVLAKESVIAGLRFDEIRQLVGILNFKAWS